MPSVELRDTGIADSYASPQHYEERLSCEKYETKNSHTSPCQSTDYDGECKVQLFDKYVHSPGIE